MFCKRIGKMIHTQYLDASANGIEVEERTRGMLIFPNNVNHLWIGQCHKHGSGMWRIATKKKTEAMKETNELN